MNVNATDSDKASTREVVDVKEVDVKFDVFKHCTAKDIGLVIGSTVLSMLAASAVFVAGLAWNEALKREVARFNSELAIWVYVVVVTIVVALLAVLVAMIRVAIAGEGGECFAALTGTTTTNETGTPPAAKKKTTTTTNN